MKSSLAHNFLIIRKLQLRPGGLEPKFAKANFHGAQAPLVLALLASHPDDLGEPLPQTPSRFESGFLPY